MNVTAFLSSVSLSRESSTESGLGTPDASSYWIYFYQSPYNELSLSVSLCCHFFKGKMYGLPAISTA